MPLRITFHVPAAEFDIADFPVGTSSFPISTENVAVTTIATDLGDNMIEDHDHTTFELSEVLRDRRFVSLERVP